MNSQSTYITKIKYILSNWQGRSGSITVTKDPGWPITNRNFEIARDLDPSLRVTINGTFSESGQQASGTWNAVLSGTTYSGSWQASPKSV